MADISDDDIIDLVRSVGLDWHAGFTLNDGEENRYAQLVRAVLALRPQPVEPSDEPDDEEIMRLWGGSIMTGSRRTHVIAFARAVLALKPAAREPLSEEYIEQHIGPDEGDREAVTAIVREVEQAHGIAAAPQHGGSDG